MGSPHGDHDHGTFATVSYLRSLPGDHDRTAPKRTASIVVAPLTCTAAESDGRDPLALLGCGRRRSAQDAVGGLDHPAVENRGADVLEVHVSAERTKQ